jgi:hypothetical protein
LTVLLKAAQGSPSFAVLEIVNSVGPFDALGFRNILMNLCNARSRVSRKAVLNNTICRDSFSLIVPSRASVIVCLVPNVILIGVVLTLPYFRLNVPETIDYNRKVVESKG